LKYSGFIALLCVATIGLSACNGGGASSSIPGTGGFAAFSPKLRQASGSTPISHIILIVQENRTLNNLFATFPGANGTTVGKRRVGKKKRTQNVDLTEVGLFLKKDLNHTYSGFLTAYDGGRMDGFNEVKYSVGNKAEGTSPYVYVNPSQIVPYWTMAQQYALAAAMFTTQGSASFSAHQDLIRGGTFVDSSHSLIDNPKYGNKAWGCDSSSDTVTSLITTGLQLQKNAGPFPCTDQFPASGSGYATLRDLLDAQSVSWKYYTPAIGESGAIWSAFDVIAPVRNGPEWNTNVSSPETNILGDISNGTLPAVSWVVPDGQNSDHPSNGSDTGPSWVTALVNSIGESQYWNDSAIVIVWDDWGGFYDPVAPPLPRDNQGGPGLRVPLLMISPYTREAVPSQPGYISNTFYEFGSVVRFIEDTFNLGRLGTTDTTSNSIDDMLDFNQPPRPYLTIGSKYSRSYFLHQKPSHVPVDTQ
jgi:phospholipase C